jgi:tRNA U34 5-methylaminomethyl-2-thiouridine-forming methyltransferase MnmC
MNPPEIVITEDGSHSLKLAGLKEHYHSTFGALAESKHVFIEAGLEYVLKRKPSEINILEVGFGTGLNALLSLLKVEDTGCRINYFGLEKYPLPESIWGKLNYIGLIGHPMADEYYIALHQSKWDEKHLIHKNFSINKVEDDLKDFQHKSESFDLIYFDAFGPDIQPALWTKEIFNKIAQMTAPGGVLVTYSCKGDVKRALKSAGFSIEKIPGPKGKREMLRGIMKSEL